MAYQSVSDPASLRNYAEALRKLADSEKEALGFLPVAAFDEAITRNRVVAMVETSANPPALVGFALFSGVFPNARIQQIAVIEAHRRKGVASALIREVVSRHEAHGYLRVTAAVANDLSAAQAFYEKNGFATAVERSGGSARRRTIVVRARDLDNDHLLSALEPPRQRRPEVVDLGLRIKEATHTPLYAIDLNVLFDAVKLGRTRAQLARRVIGAALAHRFRLATASEFVTELNRHTVAGRVDPILELARQLPRLPDTGRAEVEALAGTIYSVVFGSVSVSEAQQAQAKSDARHLAQAALARASGFLTSDGRLLDARARLMDEIGIDVISLDEFSVMLDDLPGAPAFASQLPTVDLIREPLSRDVATQYFALHCEGASHLEPLGDPSLHGFSIEGMRDAGNLVGVAARSRLPTVDAPVRLLVHVRQDNVRCDLLVDALLNSQIAQACVSSPVAIELQDVPGQTLLRRTALLRGFALRAGGAMVKIAIGRPVTPRSWPTIARLIRRRTGLRLPEAAPHEDEVRTGVTVTGPDGRKMVVTLASLENALGPTLLAWPGRAGALVPIARRYADDLLGTATQISMFGPLEAGLLSRRTYVNSPRSAPVLRPGTPILFYESKRSNGRGAVVASARVVDSVVVNKTQLPAERMRGAVVKDVGNLSSSNEVLVTTFDHLLHFSSPVQFAALKALGAVGSQNLVTATRVEPEVLATIIDQGWPND